MKNENVHIEKLDALWNALDKAVDKEGSVTAVERAAGLKKRALKYFWLRERRDRPDARRPGLAETVEDKLRSYLRSAIGWPAPEPEQTPHELLEELRRMAGPPLCLSERERIARTTSGWGYYEEVSAFRITPCEGDYQPPVYKPDGGLTPEDYYAIAPNLVDADNRAELAQAVVENLIKMQGYNCLFASDAASRLCLGDRDGFGADDAPPDFDTLAAEAIQSQSERVDPSPQLVRKSKPPGERGREPRVAPAAPVSVPTEYLAPTEAAAFLRITPEALEHLRKSRKIRAIQVGEQRGFIYAITDLRDFAARHTIPTGEEERQRRRRR